MKLKVCSNILSFSRLFVTKMKYSTAFLVQILFFVCVSLQQNVSSDIRLIVKDLYLFSAALLCALQTYHMSVFIGHKTSNCPFLRPVVIE